MSLNSSRLAIGQGLVPVLQALQNGSSPLFGYCKLGMIFDPGANTTWAAVVHHRGRSGPAGSGGNQIGWRIDDQVIFTVITGCGPYETDDSAAQANMLTIQDILLPALHSHFQLPQASNPTQAIQSVYSVLLEQDDRSYPLNFPNGHIYLLWEVPVFAKQQYNLNLVQP